MSHICDLPARFTFVPSDGRWHLEAGSSASEKLLFLEFPGALDYLMAEKRGEPPPADRTALDPWKLRDRFLHLPRSEDDLLHFLNQAGRWDRSLGPYWVGNIWSWQDAIEDLLLHPGRDWQETISQHLNPHVGLMGLEAYLHFDFEFSDKSIWFELTPTGCVGALLATVLIDRSEGARFKICKRRDCPRKVYRVESQHKRKYCTYECAHIESVRSSRKRERKKRSS